MHGALPAYKDEINYILGMSDIAVVILDHYPDDCEAFWVYTRFMQRIRGNFEMSQKAIKQQFEALRRILAFTDGAMIRFLDKIDSGHMYFTFPWLLIIFRRVATLETLPLMWDGKIYPLFTLLLISRPYYVKTHYVS